MTQQSPAEIHDEVVEHAVESYREKFLAVFTYLVQDGHVPGITIFEEKLRMSLSAITDAQWTEMATQDPTGTGALLAQYKKVAQ